MLGINSRLDELQAAILRVGLTHLSAWTDRRRALAAIYSRSCGTQGSASPEQPWARAGSPVRGAPPRRDALAAALKERGIGTLIHYPIPLHLQPALLSLGGKPGDLPVAEQAAREVLSLPLYPELTDAQARAVAAAVRELGPVAGGGA